MTVSIGIDLAVEYRGRLAFFRRGDGFVLPGVSEVRSGETVQDAAIRAAKNYLGQEVELNGTIALYGPGRAGLKDGCTSSLLMSANLSGGANHGEGVYFASPSEACSMGLDARQMELMRSYINWKREKKH